MLNRKWLLLRRAGRCALGGRVTSFLFLKALAEIEPCPEDLVNLFFRNRKDVTPFSHSEVSLQRIAAPADRRSWCSSHSRSRRTVRFAQPVLARWFGKSAQGGRSYFHRWRWASYLALRSPENCDDRCCNSLYREA